MRGALIVRKNPSSDSSGRIDVTFVDEILEMAKTQTTYMANDLAEGRFLFMSGT